jgi:hypothetical protein
MKTDDRLDAPSRRPPQWPAMRRCCGSLLVAAVLAGASGARADDLQRFDLNGQLQVAGGTRPVSLRLLCAPDAHGGAISIELWVPQAFTRKDFDYEDFEGPDAPAGNRALTHLSLAGGKSATEIAHPAAGWYSGEDPDTFVFGLSQASHRQGKIAALLQAVTPERTGVTWVQRGFDDPKRDLHATFALDAETVKHIRATVDACLPPAAKAKPGEARKPGSPHLPSSP